MKPLVNIPKEYQNLQIGNLRFIDQNSNRRLKVFGCARLVLEIRNRDQTI